MTQEKTVQFDTEVVLPLARKRLNQMKETSDEYREAEQKWFNRRQSDGQTKRGSTDSDS